MIGTPLGVLLLFLLLMFLLAEMAYEGYIRPWLLTHPLKIKLRRKLHT